jgi:hydroxymethylbilane synthase
VNRLREGQLDAILLAKAGIDRLALAIDDLIARPLALDSFLPAPAQGALAVETREDDQGTIDAVAPLHDPRVGEATACERALLKGMGGGCHLPLGAFAHRDGDALVLSAAWGEVDEALVSATVRRVQSREQDVAAAVAVALSLLRRDVPA